MTGPPWPLEIHMHQTENPETTTQMKKQSREEPIRTYQEMDINKKNQKTSCMGAKTQTGFRKDLEPRAMNQEERRTKTLILALLESELLEKKRLGL